MKTKTKLIVMSLMMLYTVLLISSTANAEDSLQDIKTAVSNSESSIQDVEIEYTCIRRPYGSEGRDLTPAEQTKANKYPGWYKEETGTWKQKGNKVRLDRTYYRTTPATKQVQESTSYNGVSTTLIEDFTDAPDLGKVDSGRWHGFGRWFNPILTLSATGDSKFSSELNNMNAELVPGLHTVNGKSCRLLKLYKKTPKGTILRSFNVYVDPSSNYIPWKIEKYWYNFQCLEKIVEVKQLSKIGNVYVPSKAVCVTYNRPHASKTSNPVSEQELTVTDIQVNQGISDSAFEQTFAPGTRVWDSTLRTTYVIPNLSSKL